MLEKKVFLECLPKINNGGNRGKIDWCKSIGHEINFTYDNLFDTLKILDYNKNKQSALIEYKEKQTFIKTAHLKIGAIGVVIGLVNKNYKYKINDIITNPICNIKILKQIKIGESRGYLYQCLTDGYIGKKTEATIGKSKCSVCSGRKVKIGVNDIGTTHPELTEFFANKSDLLKFTYGTTKKILFKCPDCGFEKYLTPSKLIERGFPCTRCGDGISYPEKFVFNLLEQLKLNFEVQKKFKWSLNKRYDFYLRTHNCIIETHGLEHYTSVFKNHKSKGRYLSNIKYNDEKKCELAINNKISNYIVLNCSYSDYEWIKSSILASNIKEMFDLQNVNWIDCHKAACSSWVEKVCSLWNNNVSDMKKICNFTKLSRTTVIKFLKQGNEIGLCKYNALDNMKENCRNNGRNLGIPVEMFNLEDESLGIFNSASELSKISLDIFGIKLHQTGISAVCNGRLKHYKGYIFKKLQL